MIAAFWGTLAGVLVLACLAVCDLIDAPEGAHHRPPWWQRAHERNVREQARDEANLRVMQEIHAEQHMDAKTSGPAVPDGTPGSGPAAGPEPLMPLPPPAPEYEYPWLDAEPEDPHDVATDDEHADQLVGGLFNRSEDHWGDDSIILPAVK
jgi:hypothetical protein